MFTVGPAWRISQGCHPKTKNRTASTATTPTTTPTAVLPPLSVTIVVLRSDMVLPCHFEAGVSPHRSRGLLLRPLSDFLRLDNGPSPQMFRLSPSVLFAARLAHQESRRSASSPDNDFDLLVGDHCRMNGLLMHALGKVVVGSDAGCRYGNLGDYPGWVQIDR